MTEGIDQKATEIVVAEPRLVSVFVPRRKGAMWLFQRNFQQRSSRFEDSFLGVNMFFALFSLVEFFVLVLNGFAIVNRERVLNKVGSDTPISLPPVLILVPQDSSAFI